MKYKRFFVTGVLFVLFAAFTLAIMTIDVKPIGPDGSSVGFATFNDFFRSKIGVNLKLYNITEILGYICIATAGIFACLGIYQTIKRKNIFKVDKTLMALGGLYVLAFIFYVIFNALKINFRPVIIDGELKPSYPSSHTLLSLTFISGAMLQTVRYIKNKKLLCALEIIAALLGLSVIVLRVLSGVHWITDIIGSVLLGLALAMLYCSVSACVADKDNK